MTVTVIIPVLNRPHRVEPLLESLHRSQRQVPLEPLFVVSADDRKQRLMVTRSRAAYVVATWEPGRADFQRKVNLGCRSSDSEWVFAGADDLDFHSGWADEAISVGEQAGRRFVSTNDLGNPLVMRGRHATHPLVHRSYLPLAVVDSPGDLYSESYDHSYCDVEATETAQRRQEFVFARNAVVDHRHFIWRKAEIDSTYEKGQRMVAEDRRLLASRRRLWRHLQPVRSLA